MKLTTQDADHYFDLMWALQAYVNQTVGIMPEVASVEEYATLPSREKLVVRDALYDNIDLIDAFLETAQGELSEEESAIVRSWKEFKRGDFFIERLLKKHAIFIGDNNKVYGVFALHDTFEELLPYVRLPYYARTVLLPFKGKIIYDGILQGYSVTFGGGMKSNLKETYLAAKQNGRIIASFDPQKQAEEAAKKKKPGQDWGPTLDDISKQAKKLRSSRGSPAIQSPAFSAAKASIEFAKIAVENPDDLAELWRALKKVDRALNKAAKVLNRAEYP